MNEELKKRKADVKKYLDDQLEKRPQKWWQFIADIYTETGDMGNGKNHYPHNPEETIVKYDFKRALTSGALFFVINFLVFFIGSGKGDGFPPSFLLVNVVLLAAITIPLVNRNKRGTLMIFNKQGFRIGKMPGPIPWHHLVASYIRQNNSGEDTTYYLLLFYYNEMKDEFEEIEYNMSGLDMDKEDVAAQIEYWKMISGNNRITI